MGAETTPDRTTDRAGLRPDLRQRHVRMIALGGVIGASLLRVPPPSCGDYAREVPFSRRSWEVRRYPR